MTAPVVSRTRVLAVDSSVLDGVEGTRLVHAAGTGSAFSYSAGVMLRGAGQPTEGIRPRILVSEERVPGDGVPLQHSPVLDELRGMVDAPLALADVEELAMGWRGRFEDPLDPEGVPELDADETAISVVVLVSDDCPLSEPSLERTVDGDILVEVGAHERCDGEPTHAVDVLMAVENDRDGLWGVAGVEPDGQVGWLRPASHGWLGPRGCVEIAEDGGLERCATDAPEM